MTQTLDLAGYDKLPPQNIEAEEAILGGILLDPDVTEMLADILVAEAFYIQAHRDIYHAALQLSLEHKHIDLLTVTSWLSDHDLLARVGGRNKLASLVDRTVSALKLLARECTVPIVLLSQLNRGVEDRTNKRPMLSDLRDSGRIEEDADMVLGVYRDEYYNPESPDRGVAELSIMKNRSGATGTIKLLFEPHFTRFKNLKRI